MKNPFNIKKDIYQIKYSIKKIENIGEKIVEKSPLLGSTTKSIFVIIKWLVIIVIIYIIIVSIYNIIEAPYQKCLDRCPSPPLLSINAFSKLSDEERDQRWEENSICRDECNIKYGK